MYDGLVAYHVIICLTGRFNTKETGSSSTGTFTGNGDQTNGMSNVSLPLRIQN
jgi:hypothetical protein